MNERTFRVLEFKKVKENLKKYSKTQMGRKIIDELVPYETKYEMEMALKETKEALDMLVSKGAPPFEGLYDVREAIERAGKGGVLSAGQILRVGNMLKCSRRFKEYVKREEEELAFERIEDLAYILEPLKDLEDYIERAIVSEDEISDRASATLRSLRRNLKEKNSSVREKINSIVRSYSKYLQETLYTMRGERYVLPVKVEYKGQVPGIVHDQSSTGATLFIEPMSLVNLNNEIKELMLKEKAEIERILQDLSLKIANNINICKSNNEILGKLDFIFAKGAYASSIDGTYPNVSDDGRFDIISARHPLINPKEVISSDIYLGDEYNVIMITGPNTGGKTVTLKTVGLIHLMGMSGLLIPAKEGSTIAYYKEIFADIGDEQSIEQSLSSFSAHLKNIQFILDNITKSSLVLLDELGSGTDPTEGSAFAMAVIDYLKDRKCRSIITTHYSEVKAHGYNEEGIETASMEFDVNTLSPTYKLLIGIPGESNALTIAKRLGVSEEVIAKAKSYISDDNKKIEKMITNIKEKSDELDGMKEQVEALKAKAKQDRDEYAEKLRVLEKEKNEILKQAYEKADAMMREMQAKAVALVEKIQKEENKKEDIKNVQKSLNMLRSALQDDKKKTVEEKPKIARKVDYKRGDKVFVNSLNQFATVLKINTSKETVQVQAGILKLEVSMDDVKVIKEKTHKEYNTVSVNRSSVRNEIDLRGKMVDEAVFELETYLDRAMMNSYSEVYIIHGKGTGALREGIINYLKNCRYVKEYRLGGHGEGGLGCTVVTLK